MNTPVTMHFTIEELYASATAKAKGIDNKPPIQPLICLVYLAAYVLEPLRDAMNEPIRISSGYRCERLNRAVGGVSNSQHTKGQAADCGCDDPLALAKLAIKKKITFDQMIVYPSFVHFSYKKDGENRGEVFYSAKYRGPKL